MISVAQGTEYRKGEIIIYTGAEEIPCPVCGGHLRVHGTCMHKLRRKDDTNMYRLRVMECKSCGKTHRELPEGIALCKRMDAEQLINFSKVEEEDGLEGTEDMENTEGSTWKRVRE